MIGEARPMLPNESAVYYPEDLSLLGQVMDQVIGSLPPNLRTPYNRAMIAKNILACAATGERDPDELRRSYSQSPPLAEKEWLNGEENSSGRSTRDPDGRSDLRSGRRP